MPTYRVFHGERADLCRVSGVVTNTLSLRSRGIIEFRLLLLAATPVARVALAALAFARQRDYLYVVVTHVVLTVLCSSLTGGHV